MPPLSAYTPLESLLFFQSLAGSDTRPASFVSISDLLRSNKFIRENGAFDAHRLSPEALEDLYTILMRDGLDSSGTVSTLEPNGHHPDSTSPSNPKKRKISGPRPDGLSDGGMNHVGLVPGMVAHLYARYKELVTKEIRIEEKRFRDISDEIERLQKEEREVLPEKVSEPAPTPVAQTKHEPAPEPMDLDTSEKPAEQSQPPRESKPAPIETAASVGAKQPRFETQRKDQSQLAAQIIPQPATSKPQPQALPVGQYPEAQTTALPHKLQPQLSTVPQQPPPSLHPIPQQLPQLQPQPQPPVRPQPAQPTAPNLPPQPQLPNGKAPPILQQPVLAPPNTPGQEKVTKVPPQQSQKPVSTPVAVAPSPGPTQGPVGTPLQTSQAANVPILSPIPQKAPTTAKTPGKKGAPSAPVSTAPPRVPLQSSFQQWSLNPPQTPQHPPSFAVPGTTSHVRPPQPPSIQQTPKPEHKAQQISQPVAAPSTPQPTLPVFQSPAPPVPASGFTTPIGPVQGLRPRLSIRTPGSSTPWKQSPHLTLPHSPRSPDRPRPEDVSPISEKAPSLFGSREATPEEREPPRRRGLGRGRKKATETDQGGPKKKGDKATGLAGKKRDRSTASSRSRGRSVLSRDEESGTETGKIKREMPSTPAGIVDSAEPERSSAGRKGATTENRPGRGRPKRKRAPSEVPEPEPPQSELSQLNRVDPNQQAPFVLCARNFPRTGAPIMNDVTTHKHASIFTKPLTERDAPGYRDLIYRPQDLKSIKSAIHQGSRALAAATEAANTPVADGESPAPNAGTASKNAVLMLQKAEDVIPPKAIVNSAQLETELIRMFANAVMFNPVPQRGFGPAFPMIADGRSGRRSYAPEPDEGGIIKDTLEMFEDVEQAVTRWRAAERTADELASKNVLALRKGSASDPNTDTADDVKG